MAGQVDDAGTGKAIELNLDGCLWRARGGIRPGKAVLSRGQLSDGVHAVLETMREPSLLGEGKTDEDRNPNESTEEHCHVSFMRGELTVTYGADELFLPCFIKKHLKREPRWEKELLMDTAKIQSRGRGLQLALFMAGIGTFT